VGPRIRHREEAGSRRLHPTPTVARVARVTVHAGHEPFDVAPGLGLQEGRVRTETLQRRADRATLRFIEPEVRRRRGGVIREAAAGE
jgi:hypothetical protein